jgi:hypothetical protein
MNQFWFNYESIYYILTVYIIIRHILIYYVIVHQQVVQHTLSTEQVCIIRMFICRISYSCAPYFKPKHERSRSHGINRTCYILL